MRSCTINLLDKRLGILDGRGNWNPGLVHRFCKIHGCDNVRHDQKDVRLGERLAGAHSATEPKYGVNLASGFRVHLSPEPLRLELFGFRVQFFIPRDGTVIGHTRTHKEGVSNLCPGVGMEHWRGDEPYVKHNRCVFWHEIPPVDVVLRQLMRHTCSHD